MKLLHSPRGEIRVGRDLDEISREAAELLCRLAQAAISNKGRFAVALSGGSTPRRLYELLGSAALRGRILWPSVHVFWGDERCVSPDHPQSNYRMAYELLLSQVPIPTQNIHRMHGEDDPPRAAEDYERTLRDFFKLQTGELPRFDLILLGLGEDGHTASLFPGSPALDETDRLVVAPYIEKLHASRLTLTFPVINHAAVILFVVSGSAKPAVLREVLEPGAGEVLEAGARDVLERRVAANILPAARVRPAAGQVYWFVDQAAASDWPSLSAA
ncbi:MAG: 6-phosphogluconolactonase [Terriglobales bacterium]